MPTDDFAIAIAPLKELGGQRVWSLMISLFGDMARDEGQVIDGPVLSAVMSAMDVRAEAARVALHRLRKDNWIASEKHGRISKHSLTPEGRAESQLASGRIYAAPDRMGKDWQMVLLESPLPEDPKGFVPIAPRLYAGSVHLTPPAGAFVTQHTQALEWLQRQLEPAHLAEPYLHLQRALQHAVAHLPPCEALAPLQTAILRCLIVHNWRRLALKHPALPLALMRDDWTGLVVHRLVTDLLAAYPRPPLAKITAV